MKHSVLVSALLLMAACSSTEQRVVSEEDPVQDFIKMHDLQGVTVIRGFEQPGVLFMKDFQYIIAYLREEQYLLQYAHECRLAHLDSADRPRDSRRFQRSLYTSTDTFRGCPVKAAYPITYPQAEELMSIGRAPGEEPRR